MRKKLGLAAGAAMVAGTSLLWSLATPLDKLALARATAPFHGLVLNGHRISEEGEVYPSVVCNAKGCEFHEFVLLEGWSQGALS